MAKPKQRLDLLLVERGLAETRERARALIMAGSVTANGQRADKPGMSYAEDVAVEVKEALPYVSRGGFKLAGALAAFGLGPREAGRTQVGKGGVVRDPAIHRAVLDRVAGEFAAQGLALAGLARSPLLGPAGNVEFLAYLERTLPPDAAPFDLAGAIDQVLTAPP